MKTQQIETAKNESLVSFVIPFFPGWYESWLDGELDYQIERDDEYITGEQNSKYYADDPSANFNFPPELKLEPGDVSNAYMRVDWSDYRLARTQEYVSHLKHAIESETIWAKPYDNRDMWNRCLNALGKSIEFETMTSPRFYNFETDRLFCFGDRRVFDIMLRLARNDENRAAWDEAIAARHSSYDGFRSHYPNRDSEWPVSICDFDHNHLATLFLFACQQAIGKPNELAETIYGKMLSDGEDYAFYAEQLGDATFAELRAEKLLEWLESDFEAFDVQRVKSPALDWLAENLDSPVAIAARESNPDAMREYESLLAENAPPLRCDKTGELFS